MRWHIFAPSDLCPTDLDRILTEGQDPDAQQYLVLGTVPIEGKNLGFWVPMHLLYIKSKDPGAKQYLVLGMG